MGLFSKWRRPRAAIFAERDLEFNRAKVQKAIVGLSEALYQLRHEASHETYTDYLRQLLNLEILQLAEGKIQDPETYAYRRGRIDSLRHALNLREKFILDKKALRESKVGKTSTDHEAKRSYVRSPSVSAGLSI